MGNQVVQTEVAEMAARMQDAGPEVTWAAFAQAGIGIPGPGDVPDKAWDKMDGWQVWSLLILMFAVVVGLFVWLLNKGIDISSAADATEQAKTLGTTIVGAALAMVGTTAVASGAALKK